MRASRSLPQAIDYYLECRRQLGFELQAEGGVLKSLACHVQRTHHQGPLTIDLVERWAQEPTEASPHWWARRWAIARQFAQFWVAFDPRTQVPPPGRFGPYHRRPAVHIYTPQQIAQLLEATASLGPAPGWRAATFRTLFGLLAATGLRISEALGLQRQDWEPDTQTLLIQSAKFSPARRIPIQSSTAQALRDYEGLRPPAFADPALFLDTRGHPLNYDQARTVFGQLRHQLGWQHTPRARLHDLRHTFAVRCLLAWNQQPSGVAPKMQALAAYLGHRHVTYTYWYLTAIPELLQATSQRFLGLVTSSSTLFQPLPTYE